MKKIVKSEHIKEILSQWRGARAKIWMFHATHKRLALLISRHEQSEVIYIIANGCEHVTGPFSWTHSNVSIEKSSGDADKADCKVVDGAAGFTLRCSDVIVVKAASTDFPTNFDNFL